MNNVYFVVHFVGFWLNIQKLQNMRILHKMVALNRSDKWDTKNIQKTPILYAEYTLFVQLAI